jgi:gamma-glutamylcyclotransferase (GGCT)/AIG2-like uncharacterized protein YtfP
MYLNHCTEMENTKENENQHKYTGLFSLYFSFKTYPLLEAVASKVPAKIYFLDLDTIKHE